MEQDHPNWVAERAKCDIARLFDSLVACIAADIERFNAEPSVCRDFILSQQKHECVIESHTGERTTYAVLTYRPHSHHIEMRQGEQTTHLITTRWDAVKSRCYVVVETLGAESPTQEFPHKKLWKAAQYLLEPILFPPPRNP